MKKNKGYKPKNKDRDEALSHLLGKSQVLEQMIEGLSQTFDEYLVYKEDKEGFMKHFNDKMKRMLSEAQNNEEKDGESLEEDSENEGRRTEGVCEDK